MSNLNIKLTKSLNSCKKDQIATAHALGLRKIGQQRIQPDNEATQGKIRKINHLIEVNQA